MLRLPGRPANDLEWRREWIDAEKTTDGPIGVGARYRLTGTLLGRRIASEYETITFEPDRLAAWRVVSGPLPLAFSRALGLTLLVAAVLWDWLILVLPAWVAPVSLFILRREHGLRRA